jgi:cytochrome c553
MGLRLCALGLLGGLVLVSGVVPVAASSGHFRITKWFLSFAMQRSVSTHSMGIDVPELDDPRLVSLGAGHYEGGCRFCHGAPGSAPPVVAASSTPAAPPLTDVARRYGSAELFYIVKNGIKFTGMPAWPSRDRDDEVWAVVAFLKDWADFDRHKYEGAVYGSTRGLVPEGAPVGLQKCSRCHGTRGQGRGQSFPVLAAQSSEYLSASLLAYARGHRPSGIMQQVADLSDTERSDLARWFASQPAPSKRGSTSSTDPLFIAGQQIAERGIAQRSVPSCQHCHGPGTPMREAYPVLSGQPSTYLKSQMDLFARGVRGGSVYAKLMVEVNAHALLADEIESVSAYYSSLDPATQR